MSFQLTRSLLAYIGRPGKAMKVDRAQKNVSSTRMQLGSEAQPDIIGLMYVEFCAPARCNRHVQASILSFTIFEC